MSAAPPSLLPPSSHDDVARQRFVLSLKSRLRNRMKPLNKTVYEKRAAAAFKDRHGKVPDSRTDAFEALGHDPYYQAWSSAARVAQDMMWDAVCSPVERGMESLAARAEQLARERPAGGSLTLKEGFREPVDLSVTHIHGQPGGYMLDRGGFDVTAGAYYEAGGAIYTQAAGNTIASRSGKAELVARLLAEHFADFRPQKILDIGCGPGSSTIAYPQLYPGAEMHAVDAGPGFLRYAHIMAEAAGVPVHFKQADAGDPGYEDGSFDLVVSHNTLHELAPETRRRMMRESLRLLRPGGIAVHQDVSYHLAGQAPVDQALACWDQYNNDEPWWESYAETDFAAMMVEAGFPEDGIVAGDFPKIAGSGTWYVAMGRKPA